MNGVDGVYMRWVYMRWVYMRWGVHEMGCTCGWGTFGVKGLHVDGNECIEMGMVYMRMYVKGVHGMDVKGVHEDGCKG